MRLLPHTEWPKWRGAPTAGNRFAPAAGRAATRIVGVGPRGIPAGPDTPVSSSRSALDRLHPRFSPKTGGLKARSPVQILDQRDSQLGAGNQYVPESRRKDAIREQASPEIRKPCFQPLSGMGDLPARQRLAPQRGYRPVQRTESIEFPTAGAAAGHVMLHALCCRRRRLTDGCREEILCDPGAGSGCVDHRGGSSETRPWPSSPWRILRSAWNTCALALSAEHPRLWPIASYSNP